MRAYKIPKGCKSIDELHMVELPDPQPAAGQVLVRIRAASFNYRDQAVITGNYFSALRRDTIPMSDAAGEVIAVGAGVTRLKVGDRVAGTFSQPDPKGPPTGPPEALGNPLDGVLAEQIVMYEQGAVPLPEGYSFEEGSCLPCAGVTAWNALMIAGRCVRPGDTVLILGTGGVSVWGLLFARAAGCRVVATSSSDQKLERIKALGASDVINYKQTPDWHTEVMRLTGGRGVDAVVEVGGTGTLSRSFQSLARGGKVCLIGVLSHSPDTNPHILMLKGGSLHGIFVGDRQMFDQMTMAINVNRLRPIIDKAFPFEQAKAAYQHHLSGNFIGKVVIQI